MLSWRRDPDGVATDYFSTNGKYEIYEYPSPRKGTTWEAQAVCGKFMWLGTFNTVAEAKAACEQHEAENA